MRQLCSGMAVIMTQGLSASQRALFLPETRSRPRGGAPSPLFRWRWAIVGAGFRPLGSSSLDVRWNAELRSDIGGNGAPPP